MQLKRHEIWRAQYRVRRYMEHLDETALEQRLRDVITNLTILSEAGQLSLRPVPREGEQWVILWTHILEEYALRGIGLPASTSPEGILLPKTTWPDAPRAAKAIKGRNLTPGTYLVKYGKERYIRQAYMAGIIRIAPASSYEDPSLNPSIKDSELQLSVELLPSETKLHITDGQTGKPKGRLRPVGNIKVTQKSRTNYYVYCLSTVYDYRLFDDFEANSCLIIGNAEGFLTSLISAFEAECRGWHGWHSEVRYIDPLNISDNDIDVFFGKHFRYSYQKEYRVVWLPENEQKKLAPVLLEVGGLSDCADLIAI